jgi:hypothetical protein
MDADDERPVVALRIGEALAYGAVVASAVVVVAAAVSFALGAGWGGLKYALFFIGFLAFGIGAIGLRPAPPWTNEDDSGVDALAPTGESGGRLWRAIWRLPVFRQYHLAPEERSSSAARLFVASLFMLGVSLAMETVLGVTA